MNDFGKLLLEKHYCKEGEKVEDTFKRACDCFGSTIKHSERLQEYLKKDWFMFSSPILSNAIKVAWDRNGDSDNRKIFLEEPKGMPISCFLGYVPDTIKGLTDHSTEFKYLSVKGGGVGGHWSDVRSMDDMTPGAVGFMKDIDTNTNIYKQGKTRRGSYASYLNLSHPESIDFIKMRTPTGDLNRKSLNLHHGVNLTDDFIDAVENDLDWSLVDPHSLEVKEVVKARELWEEALTTRFRTGEPFLNYLDEANDKLHPALKAKGLRIHGSNLCNEIHLPTNEDRTAVCCLSSVNVAKYDEWKDDEYFIADLIEMLDNVLDYFIRFAPEELKRAVTSAKMERSIGLGAMGYHDYLQSKLIPWESSLGISVNRGIFKHIKTKARSATKELAKIRGEAPDGIGYGDRNLHLLAIAPNANSSIILGVNPSIEPRVSNAYTHKTRVGSHLVKNPYLEKYLKSIQLPTTEEEVWNSIIANDGSVQHLKFLPEDIKKVFKTAFELDQHWVVLHARARQEYLCQGQSVNLFFPAGSPKKYVNSVHLMAFSNKESFEPLKGLYYLRTEAVQKTEKVSLEITRNALQDGVQGSLDECLACHA